MVSNDRLGKGLYRVINLYEAEKLVLSYLGFLVFSLVSFLMSENCFFTLPGL